MQRKYQKFIRVTCVLLVKVLISYLPRASRIFFQTYFLNVFRRIVDF